MDITLHSFPSGAAQAKGSAIIIDVFRAFTTAAFAMDGGATEIIMVGELDDARALKTSGRAQLSIGERKGLKPEDFDFGNSPTAMMAADLRGTCLVQTTTNGTASLLAAANATTWFTGALVNLSATVNAATQDADTLSIVAAGRNGTDHAEEDERCAKLMASLARGEKPDLKSARETMESMFLTEDYLASRSEFGPREDWHFALEIDRFDFAIEVSQEEGHFVARRA